MIIFLYGSDDYRLEMRKRAIIAEFVKRRSASGVGRFDLEEKDEFTHLEEFAKNQSMFDPMKLAVVTGLFDGEPEGADALLKSFLERKEITFLVTERKKAAETFAFLMKKPLPAMPARHTRQGEAGGRGKARQAGVLVEQFEALKGAEWQRFAAAEAKARGITFAPDAFAFLCDAYEGESWRLVTELEKLQWLGKKKVTKEDLESSGLELAPNFWNTLQALARGGVAERLGALAALLAGSEPTAKTFNILAYQSAEITNACAGYDLAVKSGKFDYEEALLDFVIR